ncbi:tyrosine-type recombinase/integrase [Paenibacillus cremeus]|uniref:Tyrosine-type recombinase/integrase n=1 Tax=Paenibacillus cremeus TaxID=2163881 RepID=A0A559K4Y7_9BACL|nr:tyrosine-type recombinase/integrase [Paenibacillus cremeus]TVY07202.1 tyrosine-type recombinase/integrase [Paenibacillus cremeus]
MIYRFQSGFKSYIEGVIEQKRAVGYSYESQAYILWCFDRFCLEYCPQEKVLTKEVALHWAKRKENEHPSSLQGRISPVRQLAKYMNSIGIEAYIIPQGLPGKCPRYVPHIYTDNELHSFFTEADKCRLDKRSPARHLVSSVVFRLIYCCGLRSSEARLLKVEDVDLEVGAVRIRDSKAKNRTVVMAEDVRQLCKSFNEQVEKIFPGRDWFFPNQHGSHYSSDAFIYMFHQIWDRTGITNICGNPPRVHDFRHTFSVKRLNLWVDEGKDLNAVLPYLSMYLGHATLSETDYYLHLVHDFFSVITERTSGKFAHLIPEAEYEG